MKKALIAAALFLLLAGGVLATLFQVWAPDEAALRTGGWIDDAAKARAESASAGRPMLVKFGLHG